MEGNIIVGSREVVMSMVRDAVIKAYAYSLELVLRLNVELLSGFPRPHPLVRTNVCETIKK